jgi:hypothetical protein
MVASAAENPAHGRWFSEWRYLNRRWPAVAVTPFAHAQSPGWKPAPVALKAGGSFMGSHSPCWSPEIRQENNVAAGPHRFHVGAPPEFVTGALWPARWPVARRCPYLKCLR